MNPAGRSGILDISERGRYDKIMSELANATGLWDIEASKSPMI